MPSKPTRHSKVSAKARTAGRPKTVSAPLFKAAKAQPRPYHEYLKQFIGEVAGEQGLKIATVVGDGATDEKVEQKTSIKIAEVRSILNHLHSFGIVEYNREKNMSNGWFTYTWRVNRDRALQNFLAKKRREHAEVRKQLSQESGVMFYKCRKGCARLPFEHAMDAKFRCPQCSSLLYHYNGRDELRKLEGKISALEKIASTEVGKPPE